MKSTSNAPRFQFNLLTLFGVVTGSTLILCLFFGVGRMFGMSGRAVIAMGLANMLYSIPTLIIWTAGLLITFSRRQVSHAYMLASAAFAGFLLFCVLGHLSRMLMINAAMQAPPTNNNWYLFANIGYSMFHVVTDAACWILLLIAFFAHSKSPSSAVPAPNRVE